MIRARFVLAFVLAAWVHAGSEAQVPLRDDCAREAVKTWPFISEYPPPTDREWTFEEREAAGFLRWCRGERWRLEEQWRLSETQASLRAAEALEEAR